MALLLRPCFFLKVASHGQVKGFAIASSNVQGPRVCSMLAWQSHQGSMVNERQEQQRQAQVHHAARTMHIDRSVGIDHTWCHCPTEGQSDAQSIQICDSFR